MKYVKWSLIGMLVLIVGGFLQYTLPGTDIVRIVATEVRRIEIGNGAFFWAGAEPTDATSGNRDVKFISAIRENGRPIVYRNEDTGWGWPPYFKVNSADLQARAADLTSTAEAPKWVAVRKYGWRNQFLSIYPNAMSVRQVSGPDVTIFPWFNVIFLIVLAALCLWIWQLWVRFRKARVEPVLEDVGEAIERVDDHMDAASDKARGLWQRLFGGGKSGS
ncbi:MAG: DUF1523 family protein [Pseudomonadota bacterium]